MVFKRLLKGEDMKYMQKEMLEQFMQDLHDGKIWGLRLVKTPINAIHNNAYGDIFGIPRQIVKSDNEKFYMLSRRNKPYFSGYNGIDYVEPHCKEKTDIYAKTEAYYSAFNYYDGCTLQSITEVQSPVNEDKSVLITEYEIIRSY